MCKTPAKGSFVGWRLDQGGARKDWRESRLHSFGCSFRFWLGDGLLDRNGREATHKALTKLLTKAQAKNLIVARRPAADLATRYFAILWDDLLIRLLMRLREPPTDDEIRERAQRATETLF
jgi:hypothetical protein